MNLALFCHSIRSDWNHGNAHFLRGVVRSLQRGGDTVTVHEPAEGWSVRNLVQDHGPASVDGYLDAYPDIRPRLYGEGGPDLSQALEGQDAVIVHEWTDPSLVRAIARHHDASGNYDLFFHDSHHRAKTNPDSIAELPLHAFTGVLAFGDSLRQHYAEHGLAGRAWTWHEAADPDLFRPIASEPEGDLVWVGNWGDEERTEELEEYLVGPAERLRLRGTVHGVRYPDAARKRLAQAGLAYRGWLPNIRAPQVFAAHRATVHVPRRPYLQQLPGIPTIRMFEAFASGIPLAVALWKDTERLFRPGDYLLAHDGAEMEAHLRTILEEPERAARMAQAARKNLLERHTCEHRVRELRGIRARLRTPRRADGLRIAFFGSSLLSSYWNGAATYYRGLLRALADLGHTITFHEPDAFDRTKHQDMAEPDWCRVHVYSADGEAGVREALHQASAADVVVKASGVGAHDALLEAEVADLGRKGCRTIFWDVDAPATLRAMAQGGHRELREALPRYDAVLTYGGGPRVVAEYTQRGARSCTPVYNALDPATHHAADPDPAYRGDLAFLGNRLPDREARVKEFFLDVARDMPERGFVLGGAGWEPHQMTPNVRYVGHVGTRAHNAFNSTPTAVLNVNRASMAEYGHSPPTRIFEAAGAGACIITDAWPGVEEFFEPGREILVAGSGEAVARLLRALDPAKARAIGAAARRRALREHTYTQRALQVDAKLRALCQEVVA